MRFNSSTSKEGELLEHTGTCHRYPPVYTSHSDTDYEDKYEIHGWCQPTIDLMPDVSDWCGEFEPIGQ